MDMDLNEKRARQVVKKLFLDFSGTVMTREQALEIIPEGRLQNNTGPMSKYGYADYDRSDEIGRKILTIRLTSKGKQFIDDLKSGNGTVSQEDLPSLDAVGAYMERFNSRNKYYQLELVRKEEASHR